MSEIIGSDGGHEDEVIYIQKDCGYWNHQSFLDSPSGILVVTNYRLFYKTTFSTVFTKTGYLSISLESIEDLEITKYMSITPAIRFRADGKQYGFTILRKADEVLKVIEEARKARIAQKEIQKKVSGNLRGNSNICINNKCSNDIFVAIRFKHSYEWKTDYCRTYAFEVQNQDHYTLLLNL